MNARRIVKTAAYGALAGGAIATTGYAALVALNRATYGDGKTSADGAKDPVLDRFIPSPDVRTPPDQDPCAGRGGDGSSQVVATTDAAAGERFRRYWSYVAPGVKLIRVALLHPLRQAAEKSVRAESAV